MKLSTEQFRTRSPPQFASPGQHRAHVLRRLAGTCRIFGQRGYTVGLLGHITVRDPEHADRFWVNPVGVPMSRMQVSDLVQVSHDGEILQGKGPVNPAGLLLHTAVHRARPDVAAMCHSHSMHGSTWAALGRPLDPITQDACVFYERQAVIMEPRVVRDAAGARAFAAAFGDMRVAIHANHGLFTTGQTLDEAAWWFVLLDQCCETQLRAEAAGTPLKTPEADARWTASVLGTPLFGWLSYQTLWDELLPGNPDLAD